MIKKKILSSLAKGIFFDVSRKEDKFLYDALTVFFYLKKKIREMMSLKEKNINRLKKDVVLRITVMNNNKFKERKKKSNKVLYTRNFLQDSCSLLPYVNFRRNYVKAEGKKKIQLLNFVNITLGSSRRIFSKARDRRPPRP